MDDEPYPYTYILLLAISPGVIFGYLLWSRWLDIHRWCDYGGFNIFGHWFHMPYPVQYFVEHEAIFAYLHMLSLVGSFILCLVVSGILNGLVKTRWVFFWYFFGFLPGLGLIGWLLLLGPYYVPHISLLGVFIVGVSVFVLLNLGERGGTMTRRKKGIILMILGLLLLVVYELFTLRGN